VGRVLDADQAARWIADLHQAGKVVVFTNGVFDILHAGHVDLLERAAALGDVLVVGLNSDASTRRLKGERRPVLPEIDRARVLAALEVVNAVVKFEEDTPEALLRRLLPDVLVKGADYAEDEIVGKEMVEARGGRVVRVPLVEGRSTSAIVEEILRRHG
jgi:D-beta-D-heptose 7-phosphate kinase/D-beta-D-heptose 1-phosphate adenosyltransferase